MKVRLIDSQSILFSKMDENSQQICILEAGAEFRIKDMQTEGSDWLAAENAEGCSWRLVTLPNGITGYLKGSTRIFRIKKLALADKRVDVREHCALDAPVKRILVMGQYFDLVEIVEVGGRQWLRIRDRKGEGFIDSNVKVRDIAAAVATAAENENLRDMQVGSLWLFGGIIVTIVSMALSGGHSYIIAWGAILFGAIRLFKGVFNASQK